MSAKLKNDRKTTSQKRAKSIHDWQSYTIMHGEQKVVSIRKDGTCTFYSKTMLPYNLYLETVEDNDVETRVQNLDNFYYWCASRVLTLDREYAKEILNSIGATQASTDRHWGNWGLLINNKSNKPIRLYDLMDFNRAFQAYDDIEGANCLTTKKKQTQKEAALEAVSIIGLNQIDEVQSHWFNHVAQEEMFRKRLDLLRKQANRTD